MSKVLIRRALFAFVSAACGFVIAMLVYGLPGRNQPKLTTEYQLVLLSNGQAYFGKLEKLDSAYPILRDVFYIQSHVDPESKQSKNSLVKRGKEWHAPDHMILEGRQIVLIEPVSSASTVARLIKEYKPSD